jgi:hypothetical protein
MTSVRRRNFEPDEMYSPAPAAWEQQPTPPTTPDMSPKQQGAVPLPKTPTRQQGSQRQPKSPNWEKMYRISQQALKQAEEDESDQVFYTASQSPTVTPRKDKGVERPYFSQSTSQQFAPSYSPTKYASPSTGGRGLVRAATEGDLQISYEDLMRKLDHMQGQLDERHEQIREKNEQIKSLIEENALLRRGSTLLETPSPLFPPSPTKTNSEVSHETTLF